MALDELDHVPPAPGPDAFDGTFCRDGCLMNPLVGDEPWLQSTS